MQPSKPPRQKLSKRTLAAALLILIVIPVTIAAGIVFLEDRSYYLISILIIFYTMLPFFMVFEKRKPQARELVILAVMVAIGVIGRWAFFWLPQFKPVTALVIIVGVCFGGESGFLVGALTGFVSNMVMGQGPWTPWQMFCFGIIGFLAGVLFRKGMLPKRRLPLCIYGGVTTLLIYGGIMNICALLMMGNNAITWASLLAVYASGIPMDLIHAAATVFFLLVFSEFFIEQLDRIKVKYGLLEP